MSTTLNAPRYLLFGMLLMAWLVSGCATKPVNQVDLMPAPEIYRQVDSASLPAEDPLRQAPYQGMLYATGRAPVSADDSDAYYSVRRGNVLRLGMAEVQLGDGTLDWNTIRELSLLKDRDKDYPLKVAGIHEFGVLQESVGAFNEAQLSTPDAAAPGHEFASLVNAQLDYSSSSDVYVYVHGYRVIFENPVLVASELWHFLGYRGAFIAFSWPSTPKKLAYVADTETAANSARELRILLEYLATATDAKRIHIVGYSAGSRVVIGALGELMLAYVHAGRDPAALRLGQVVLVGSDYDRNRFGGLLEDGLLDLQDQMTIYMSGMDRALSLSRWLYNRGRLGQMWADGEVAEGVSEYLRAHPRLSVIDVTGTEGSDSGNGHAYFRSSPWVSSDVLVNLAFGLPPEKRGLVQSDDAVWRFPGDYLQRLGEALANTPGR